MITLDDVKQNPKISELISKADEFLAQRIQLNSQRVGNLNEEQRWLEEIESTLKPSPGDLLSQLENFVQDLQNASANPEDMGTRAILENSAENIEFRPSRFSIGVNNTSMRKSYT